MSDPTFLAGETLPAGKLQQLGGLVTPYTPALTALTTSPTLGSDGTAAGIWSQQGGWIRVVFHIQFGTSGVNAGSGGYRVSLPPGMAADLALDRAIVGAGRIQDASNGTVTGSRLIVCQISTPTTVAMAVEGARFATDASPWTWAASDELTAEITYPLA